MYSPPFPPPPSPFFRRCPPIKDKEERGRWLLGHTIWGDGAVGHSCYNKMRAGGRWPHTLCVRAEPSGQKWSEVAAAGAEVVEEVQDDAQEAVGVPRAPVRGAALERKERN